MADPEQLATAHEALILLLSKMPRLALIEILCAAAGIDLIEVSEVRERTPTFEVPNLNRRARKGLIDFLLVAIAGNGVTLMHWIIEVQLCWDANKQWNWALYAVAVGAESKKPAVVAVFTPDPVLRARIRTKLIPKILPPPALVEPDHIELIDDVEEARRRPHETILGAVYHAASDTPVERRVAAIRAAWIAVQTLDPWECRSYTVLMLTTTPTDIAERAREELREQEERDSYRFITFEEYEISDLERNSFLGEKAHRIGKQEGR
ncbi:hypothetical protein, partial [Enhygromyxa salina]|uniref:hypothetical protein n=1 Tax=Enhygromyxa salina TaxID=215803 RepID=UPI000696D1E7